MAIVIDSVIVEETLEMFVFMAKKLNFPLIM